MLAAVLVGCSGGQKAAETPTLSAEDVLRTAEGIAEQTRQAATLTPSPIPDTPTSTVPPITDTPAPSVTSSSPMVTAKYSVAVRAGPSQDYEQIDLFLEGQAAEVYGRNDSSPIGAWYYIHRIGAGKDGWVWYGAVNFSGNPGLVPALPAPPTSTRVRTPRATATVTLTPSPTP
jgi:hypothetical protein